MNDKVPPAARHAGFVSQLGLDRNPLRRRTDWLESAIMAGLLAVFLAGAPLAAISSAGWAHSSGLREQRAQRSWRQVSVVLLQAAPRQAAFRHWSPPAGSGPGGRRPVGRCTPQRFGRRLAAAQAARSGYGLAVPGRWRASRDQRCDHRPRHSGRDPCSSLPGDSCPRLGPRRPVAAEPATARRLGSGLEVSSPALDRPSVRSGAGGRRFVYLLASWRGRTRLGSAALLQLPSIAFKGRSGEKVTCR